MARKKSGGGGRNILPFGEATEAGSHPTKPRGNFKRALIEQNFPEESAKINDFRARIYAAREKLIRIRDKDTLHDRWAIHFKSSESSLGRAEALLIEMIELDPASKEYRWKKTAVARIFSIVNNSLIGFSQSV